jgi:hypothetical protein
LTRARPSKEIAMPGSSAATAPLLVAVAIGLAACGSTVAQVPGTAVGAAAQDQGMPEDGLGGAAPAAGAPLPGPSDEATGGSGVRPAVTDKSVAAVGGGPSIAPGAASRPSARGRGPAGTALGVTPSTVKIGVYTVQAFNDVAASAGINVATGNQARQANAVIRYINSTGGVAGGRKLVPVFHDFNVGAAASDVNSEYQAACAAWTQDERVYAVATPVGTLNDTLYGCLSKAGVITSATGESKDAKFFREFHDFFYMPTEINMTRMLRNNAKPLAAAGFFSPDAKVGVVYLDNQVERRAVDEGLRPGLAAVGRRLDATFAAPISADGTSAYSGAVLKFKAAGITHVIFSELGSPIAFASNAESQDYRPRYAFNSRNGPASVLQSNMSRSQLSRSMAYGWMPMNDVDAQRDPGTVGSRQALCLKIAREAGEDVAQRSVAAVALYVCDSIFFIRDALDTAPDFSARGFRTGAESLGDYDTAGTFQSSFGPGRLHDGAERHRVVAFDDGCGCFRYRTPVAVAP